VGKDCPAGNPTRRLIALLRCNIAGKVSAN
jgi:hypothetical protein